MRQHLLPVVVATCLMFGAGLPVQAQSVSTTPSLLSLTLKGRLAYPRSISLAELEAMPAVTGEVLHARRNGT